MVHIIWSIIWFIIWTIFFVKNFQEDEIAQPVTFRKPLKIEFYNRLTDFSLMKPIKFIIISI